MNKQSEDRMIRVLFKKNKDNSDVGHVIFKNPNSIGFVYLGYQTPEKCNQLHWHFGYEEQQRLLLDAPSEPINVEDYQAVTIPLLTDIDSLEEKSLVPVRNDLEGKPICKPLILDCKGIIQPDKSVKPRWYYGINGCNNGLVEHAKCENQNLSQLIFILIMLIQHQFI